MFSFELNRAFNEEKMFMSDVYRKLSAAEGQSEEGKILDGDASLKSIRGKYNV